MSLETWKTDVDNFIPKLLEGEVNEKNAQLLAALFALKQRFECMDENSTISDHEVSVSGDNEATEDKQWLLDTISEELKDSEMYYNKFMESRKPEYKEISNEELHHSEILLKILREEYPDEDVQELMIWHNSMLARLV